MDDLTISYSQFMGFFFFFLVEQGKLIWENNLEKIIKSDNIRSVCTYDRLNEETNMQNPVLKLCL